MPKRWLRPMFIVVDGDAVWLVDESRPAAALVQRAAPPRLVCWRQESAPHVWRQRFVGSGGHGLVAQRGDAVVRVSRDGSSRTADLRELTPVGRR